MQWFLTAVGIMSGVAVVLLIAGYARRRAESIPSLFTVHEGAFLRLAADRLGTPDALLPIFQTYQLAEGAKEVDAPATYLDRTTGESSSVAGNTATWGAAAADGITPALEVLSRWASVDEHVFQAFAHLSHQQIDGVADLLRLVDAKSYAIESAAFANKLLGHVGEWHVQEHLIHAGASVVMPTGTNEAGLDMWADGHAVNVKTVADAGAAASSHFSGYPDIPIVVPFDSSHISSDALHFDPTSGFDAAALAGSDHLTIVDDALSHADMVGQTGHALNVLSNPGPHHHFPWVTAAVSGFREGRLLMRGNTDLGRAAKNIAVDTTAVGGGAILGMKGGAAIGMLFGPTGSVMGGIVGGFLSAIVGRAAANTVKRAPLEDAKQNYEEVLVAYSGKEAELVSSAGKAWHEAQSKEASTLREYAETIKREHQQRLEQLRSRLLNTVHLDAVAAQALLDAGLSQIEAVLTEDRKRLLAVVPRWALPWAGIIAPRDAELIAQHSAEAQAWRRQADNLMHRWSKDSKDSARCFDLVLAAPGGKAVAEKYLAEVESARRTAIEEAGVLHQEALKRITDQRTQIIVRLRDRWRQIRYEVEIAIAPIIEDLKSSADKYRSELHKAGVEI